MARACLILRSYCQHTRGKVGRFDSDYFSV